MPLYQQFTKQNEREKGQTKRSKKKAALILAAQEFLLPPVQGHGRPTYLRHNTVCIFKRKLRE